MTTLIFSSSVTTSSGWLIRAPREVSDVNKTVNTSKVNEYTIAGDILNDTFEYLTFFKSS